MRQALLSKFFLRFQLFNRNRQLWRRVACHSSACRAAWGRGLSIERPFTVVVIFCRCHPASIVALQERAAVENGSASAEHQVGKVGLDVFAAEVVIGAEAVGRDGVFGRLVIASQWTREAKFGWADIPAAQQLPSRGPYGCDGFCVTRLRCSRARDKRERTVPMGMSNTSAVSW